MQTYGAQSQQINLYYNFCTEGSENFVEKVAEKIIQNPRARAFAVRLCLPAVLEATPIQSHQ